MQTAIIFSPELKNYDFGPGHAFRSDRFDAFFKVYNEILTGDPHFQLVIHEELAGDDELKLCHTEDYINIMRAASCPPDDDFEPGDWHRAAHINLADCGPKQGPSRQSISLYVSPDNLDPFTGRLPPGIEKAARAVVKNSLLAIDFVLQERSTKAVGIGGGLHHAKASYGEGFCIYNDVVIAAQYARQKYKLERILLLDTDAHAGNGTGEAFYADPHVLFIDLHQKGIYPGTGRIEEIGAGKGKGFTVNMPLAPQTGDAAYERFFEEIIIPLAREFKPQLIIRNGGSDPHFRDTLTGLGLTLTGFKMIGEKVRQLSKELCNQKSVDLICSGYNPDVLPQAWLNLIAGLSGAPIEIKESAPRPPRQERAETKDLINQVKNALRPYWESMR